MDIPRSLYRKALSAESSAGYSLIAQSQPLSSNHDIREKSPSDPTTRSPRWIASWQIKLTSNIYVDSHQLRRYFTCFLLLLLPSFFYFPNRKPRKLSPTSYLDGLRGVAALFVVVCHYSIAYTATSLKGWGYEGKNSYKWFWLLPVFRVVHSGRFMVIIFFILSGYVLSYRSLKLARQGKHLELLDSLASSVFRRWLRLSLPVAASCLFAFMLARWDLYNRVPRGWEHVPARKSYVDRYAFSFPSRSGPFFSQLYDLYLDVRHITNPFLFGAFVQSRYNKGVLWTIPIEWMGSMITFVTVLGISRAKTWVKLSVLLLLFYQSHRSVRWEWASFFSGIFLAELSFIWSRPLEPPLSLTSEPNNDEKNTILATKMRYRGLVTKAFWVFLFTFGLYIGTQPSEGEWHKAPGYRWFYRNLPSVYAKSTKQRSSFWPSIGGIIVVFSLEMAPFLQRVFTTGIAQYLGEVSFSLYLLHFPILCTLGEWFVPKCMNITGGWANGQIGYISGMGLSMALIAPVTFWIVDVFSRLVDENSVKLARWVSGKAFVQV